MIEKFQRKEPNDREITMALANLSAHRNPTFPDQKSFDIAVRHLTESYKSPLKESVAIVKSILASAIEESAREFLDTYPKLQAEVVYLVNNNLNECEQVTWNQLDGHIEAQKAFMNTRHPAFVQESHSFKPNLRPPPQSEKPVESLTPEGVVYRRDHRRATAVPLPKVEKGREIF